MDEILMYAQSGWKHITDLGALDHILFLVALAVVYSPSKWKDVLLLSVVFAIGHSISSFLVVKSIQPIPLKWIEFLIPLSIVFMGISNLISLRQNKSNLLQKAFLTLVFGIIHGFGFIQQVISLFKPDDELLNPIIGFNLGLEVGQIVIVSITITVSYTLVKLLKLKRTPWVSLVSIFVICFALVMALQRIPN